MITFDKSNSPIFKQFVKGYAQIQLARLSTAREAVVWAFQGADNMVSAMLAEKQEPFNKKNHRDKWGKFSSTFPDFLKRISTDQIGDCRRTWEDARYRNQDISNLDAGKVVTLANEVYEFGLEILAQIWTMNTRDLREHTQDASEAELAVVKIDEIENYHLSREADAEQNAHCWGFSPFGIMLGDPATFMHFSLQTDNSEVRKLIETTPAITEKIAQAYQIFGEAITKIVFDRFGREVTEKPVEVKPSEEQRGALLEKLAEAFDFNLLLRCSFLGYNFMENVELVKEVAKAFKEGRIERLNPIVIRDSSPKIIQYDVKITKPSPGTV